MSQIAVIKETRKELAVLIGRRIDRDGNTTSPLPQVRFYRSSQPTSLAACVYKPSIIIVAQGQKQAYMGDREFTYDAFHYLVTSVPMPLHAQVRTASPETPFLSMSIGIDPAELSALIIEMGDVFPRVAESQNGISVSPLSDELFDAAVRLVRSMGNPADCKILAPLCIREILFRVLNGPQGGFLKALALRQGHRFRMARVLNLIHTSFDRDLDVAVLAEAAEMSVSTFHHTFKSITSMAPVQYVKTIRLHRARSLMLFEGLGAAEAAYQVGYRSTSQFSREYRRLFGLPPSTEVSRLQATGEAVEDDSVRMPAA